MKDFRKLQVWHKSHELVLSVYQASSEFPSHELYGLTSQIRRSAASIPTNIAEGSGHTSDAELARYLQVALASASELEYQLILARDLDYLPEENYRTLNSSVVEVKKMTAAFLKRLRS